MRTGSFNDWGGNMFDLGPLYPFVGWEVPMVILGFIFWLGWHYLQIRSENRELEEAARKLRQGDNLQRALQSEHSPQRM